jgi:hypothetical protein
MPRTERLKSRLRELDDPARLEFPRDYDYEATRTRFMLLVEKLERAFGCRCRTDLQVQDASHHADAVIPKNSTTSDYPIWVRMSNFGSLVTAGADDHHQGLRESCRIIRAEDVMLIDAACSSIGCTFVSLDVLLEPYEGPTALEEGIPDWILNQIEDSNPDSEEDEEDTTGLWFSRFFDYM